jgi:hypothetical protein
MNEGYRWKKKLFSEQGRAQLEKLTLVSWANRRRQELLELLGRMNAVIEELTAAVEREARKRPNVMRLMTHPGVGPPHFGWAWASQAVNKNRVSGIDDNHRCVRGAPEETRTLGLLVRSYAVQDSKCGCW